MEEEEAKKIVESLTDSITSGEKKDIEESTKDIVKKAALAVSSLKETEFDIRFNPDVFRFVVGGFQLELVSISRVINHITVINSSALIGGKFIFKKKSFTRFALQSECCNFNQ